MFTVCAHACGARTIAITIAGARIVPAIANRAARENLPYAYRFPIEARLSLSPEFTRAALWFGIFFGFGCVRVRGVRVRGIRLRRVGLVDVLRARIQHLAVGKSHGEDASARPAVSQRLERHRNFVPRLE